MTYERKIYWIAESYVRTGFVREGGRRVRCFRCGEGANAPRADIVCQQFVPPGENWLAATVYSVGVPDWILKRWRFQQPTRYICAMSRGAAVKELDRQFRKAILGSKKLSKRTLGVGMSKVATMSGTGRIAAGTPSSDRVKHASERYSDAKVWINGEEYGVRMDDNLCCALDAVKGGSAAVDFSVRKAMNKIAGYINYSLGGTLDKSNRRMLMPFRGIVTRRA